MSQQIGKLILHQHASEVIEYIYSQTDQEKDRRSMVYSFYGQYFLLLKQLDDTVKSDGQASLKQFMESKPQLAEPILDKIEGIV